MGINTPGSDEPVHRMMPTDQGFETGHGTIAQIDARLVNRSSSWLRANAWCRSFSPQAFLLCVVHRSRIEPHIAPALDLA